ncbi:uncharacterized protein EAF02_010437 [Botrytis sinoallii]|uniref:uncharacterized protein n=1 Tax=Botrytis sinoallii TaxID=1463999 RepID=UPI0019002B47|nr:uncharacterized protein EAF02_010437 [Botrytis sinoallii]KAF7862888.1 hypothetical protein EAF02_010437 [Botrytis sinoallii]
MSYNNYRHQDNRHRLQDFTPQASQLPTTSYISPSYRQHTARYATTAPQSDVTSRWSDTNSTTNLSETTSLTGSEKERLVHEGTEGDRRRYEKWKKWAREQKEEDRKEWAREQEEEDRLKRAAANARRQKRRHRLQVLERQIREYEDLILEADRQRKEVDG